MSTFLDELGKKLAEKWLTLLVLPGVLYLAATVAARVAGHAHPFAMSELVAKIDSWAGSQKPQTVGGQVVLFVAVVAAAAAAGLVSQALGSLVEVLTLMGIDRRGLPLVVVGGGEAGRRAAGR